MYKPLQKMYYNEFALVEYNAANPRSTAIPGCGSKFFDAITTFSNISQAYHGIECMISLGFKFRSALQ